MWAWLVCGVAGVVAVDLATKAIAVAVEGGSGSGAVVPVENPELALGIVGGGVSWMLVLPALGLVLALVLTLRPVARGEMGVWVPVCLAGGALANLVDRIASGFVHDFVATPWIVFNLADVAIVAGLRRERARAGNRTGSCVPGARCSLPRGSGYERVMRRRSLLVPALLLVVVALGAAGCGDDSGDGSTTSSRASSSSSTGPTTSTTVVTAYVDATAEVQALVPGVRGTDVEELAARIAAAFRMEEGEEEAEVVSVERGEPSVAVIAVRRGGDDSVAGADYRITFEGDEAGWAIASAEKRYACLRGVSGDVCV